MRVILSLLMVCVLGACGKEIDGVKMCQESTFTVNLPIVYNVGEGVDKASLEGAVSFWNGYFNKVVFLEGESVNTITVKPILHLGKATTVTNNDALVGFSIALDPKGNNMWVIAHELGHILGLHHTEGGLMNKYIGTSYSVTCSN